MTQTLDVPANWLPASASRQPLRLVNAVAFATSSTPPPDQWTHFARLRPVPWRLLLACIAIAVACVWGITATITQYPDEWVHFAFFLIVMAAGAVYFGWIVIRSVLSYRSRTGWPHLHGIGIGSSGIAFRLAGGSSDVPWDAITAIRATVTNELSSRKARIPVLRVEYAGSAVDLNPQILGASPVVIYTALTYYWKNPASRSELGTTVAQQRMDDWLAQVG